MAAHGGGGSHLCRLRLPAALFASWCYAGATNPFIDDVTQQGDAQAKQTASVDVPLDASVLLLVDQPFMTLPGGVALLRGHLHPQWHGVSSAPMPAVPVLLKASLAQLRRSHATAEVDDAPLLQQLRHEYIMLSNLQASMQSRHAHVAGDGNSPSGSSSGSSVLPPAVQAIFPLALLTNIELGLAVVYAMPVDAQLLVEFETPHLARPASEISSSSRSDKPVVVTPPASVESDVEWVDTVQLMLELTRHLQRHHEMGLICSRLTPHNILFSRIDSTGREASPGSASAAGPLRFHVCFLDASAWTLLESKAELSSLDSLLVVEGPQRGPASQPAPRPSGRAPFASVDGVGGMDGDASKGRASAGMDVHLAALHYVSPESTGRMGAVTVDTRSDMYTLGAVFYCLLCGQPPFSDELARSHDQAGRDGSDERQDGWEAEALLEILHCHLVKRPTEPRRMLLTKHAHLLMHCPSPSKQWNSQAIQEPGSLASMLWSAALDRFLSVLSAIILKLLSKSLHARYQSCRGLAQDLHYCKRLLLAPESPQVSMTDEPSPLPSLPLSAAPSQHSTPVAGSAPSSPPSAFQCPSVTIGEFRVAQTIYGRGAEEKLLLERFENICARSTTTGGVGATASAAASAAPPACPCQSSPQYATSVGSGSGFTRPQLVFVSGHSGVSAASRRTRTVGKTSLIDCVQPRMLSARAIFARGKFDLYSRSSSVLLQAFQQLCLHVLTRAAVERESWRSQLQAALGEEAQVLVELLPQLHTLLGPQAAVASLPPPDTERRLHAQLLAFVRVFAQASHPLILFIDDLQWSDSQTLSLLQLLFNMPHAHMLLICAFRDNEVHVGHPFQLLQVQLAEADQGAREAEQQSAQVTQANAHAHTPVAARAAATAGDAVSFPSAAFAAPAVPLPPSRITSIRLGPLTLQDIAQLCTDTLHSGALGESASHAGAAADSVLSANGNNLSAGTVSVSYALPLARYLLRKAGGIAFYIVNTLKALYLHSYFTFAFDARAWTYDIAQVEAAPLGGDVLAVISLTLRRLSSGALTLLRIASCIGHRFSWTDLLHTRMLDDASATPASVAAEVWEAMRAGFITADNAQLVKQLYLLAFPSAQDARASPPLDDGAVAGLAELSSLKFNFQHDGVQQGAYTLVAPEERSRLHLLIGRAALAQLQSAGVLARCERELADSLRFEVAPVGSSPVPLHVGVASLRGEAGVAPTSTAASAAAGHLATAPDLIDVAGHFETCIDLLAGAEEVRNVVTVCIAAGRKAKGCTAYDAALRFATLAQQILQRRVPNCLDALSSSSPHVSASVGVEQDSAGDTHMDGVASDAVSASSPSSIAAGGLAVAGDFRSETIATYLLLAEAHFVQSNFEQCQAVIDAALAHLPPSQPWSRDDPRRPDLLCRVALREIMQNAALTQNRYADSLQIGLETLRLLAFDLPPESEALEALADEEAFMARMQALVDAAPGGSCTDARHCAVARVLIFVFSASYYMSHTLTFVPVCFGQLKHHLDMGRPTPMLSFAFSCFTHVCHEWQRLSLCYRMGMLAKALVEKYGQEARQFRSRVHSSFSVAVWHWRFGIHAARAEIDRANNMCLEAGDLEYYSYTCFFGLDALLYAGRAPLERVEQAQRDALSMFRRRKLAAASMYTHLWRVCVWKLLGRLSVDEEEMDVEGDGSAPRTQAQILAQQREINVVTFLFAAYTAEVTFAFFSRQFERAIPLGEAACKLPCWLRIGLLSVPHLVYFFGLSLMCSINQASAFAATAASADPASPSSSGSARSSSRAAGGAYPPLLIVTPAIYAARSATVAPLLAFLRTWAEFAASNYAHKRDLLEAERMQAEIFLGDPDGPALSAADALARDRGEPLPSKFGLVYPCLALYASAIRGASEQQFASDEIIANELCARFHMRIELLSAASAQYVQAANLAALRWGCGLKQLQLKQEFGAHLGERRVISQQSSRFQSNPIASGSGGAVPVAAGAGGGSQHSSTTGSHKSLAWATMRAQAGVAGSPSLMHKRSDPTSPAAPGDAITPHPTEMNTQSRLLALASSEHFASGLHAHGPSSSEEPPLSSVMMDGSLMGHDMSTLHVGSFSTPAVTRALPSGHSATERHGNRSHLSSISMEPPSSSMAATPLMTDRRVELDSMAASVAIMRACAAFAADSDQAQLLRRILTLVLTYTNAVKAVLLLRRAPDTVDASPSADDVDAMEDVPAETINDELSEWSVQLMASDDQLDLGGDDAERLPGELSDSLSRSMRLRSSDALPSLRSGRVLPLSVLHLVLATGAKHSCTLSRSELEQSSSFRHDPYLQARLPPSVLLLPLVSQSTTLGLLYLESMGDCFSSAQLHCVQLISIQAALSIENARITARLQRSTVEAQRAASIKSDFLNSMSHELRTPLNAIVGMVRLLGDTDLTEEQGEMLPIITSSAQLLLGIINDILDYSRLESGKLQLELQPLDVATCVEHTVHLCHEIAAQKSVQLVYLIDPALPPLLRADQAHLQQILLNLLSNGIKFTQNGFVCLRVEVVGWGRRAEAAKEHHDAHAASHAAAAAVSPDQSPALRAHLSPASLLAPVPIGSRASSDTSRPSSAGGNDSDVEAPEMVQQLFSSFQQADSSIRRKFGGTGLGLAISQRLAHAMRGRIAFTSTLGQGSTVTLTLRMAVCGQNGELQSTRRGSLADVGAPLSRMTVAAGPASSVPLNAAAAPVLLISHSRLQPGSRFMLQELLRRNGRPAASQVADREVAAVDSIAEAGAVWAQRASSRELPQFGAVVLDSPSGSQLQSELDELLLVLQTAQTVGSSPSRSKRPLRVVVIGSRWKEGGGNDMEAGGVSRSASAGSAPGSGARSRASLSLQVSDAQRQAWSPLHVQLLLMPFKHADLLRFLTDLDGKSPVAAMRCINLAEGAMNSSSISNGALPLPGSSSFGVSDHAASAAPSLPLPEMLPPMPRSLAIDPAALPHKRSHSRMSSSGLAEERPRVEPSPSLSLYTPRSAVRTLISPASHRQTRQRVEIREGDVPHSQPVRASSRAVDSPMLPIMQEESPGSAASSTPPSSNGAPAASAATAAAASSSTAQRTAPGLTSPRRAQTGRVPTLRPTYPFRLLLVEDNLVNVKVMVMLLRRLGWELTAPAVGAPSQPVGERTVVTDGLQCLATMEAALQNAESLATANGLASSSDGGAHARAFIPQVLLMDVSMDSMDGLECTRQIRRRFDQRYARLGLPAPFIIACTANVLPENTKQCTESGMNDFIGKPVSLDLLVAALTRAGKFVFAASS